MDEVYKQLEQVNSLCNSDPNNAQFIKVLYTSLLTYITILIIVK